MHCTEMGSSEYPLSRRARQPVAPLLAEKLLPLLKTLRLANIEVGWSDLPETLSQSRTPLHTLDLRYPTGHLAPTAHQMHQILTKVPQLVHLKVHIDNRSSEVTPSDRSSKEPAHLPYLQTCDIGYVDANSVPVLFDSFVAPDAVDIILTDVNPLTEPSTWDGSVALRSLGVRLGGELRFPRAERLSLVNVSGSEESFRTCYLAFPCTHALFLHAPPMSAFRALTPLLEEATRSEEPEISARHDPKTSDLPMPQLKNVNVVASPAYTSGIRAALAPRDSVLRLEPLVLPFFSDHASRACRNEADELVSAYVKPVTAPLPAPDPVLISMESVLLVSVPPLASGSTSLATSAFLEEPHEDEGDGSETENEDDGPEARATTATSLPSSEPATASERRPHTPASIRDSDQSLEDDKQVKELLSLYPPPLPISQASSFASLCPDSDDDDDEVAHTQVAIDDGVALPLHEHSSPLLTGA